MSFAPHVKVGKRCFVYCGDDGCDCDANPRNRPNADRLPMTSAATQRVSDPGLRNVLETGIGLMGHEAEKFVLDLRDSRQREAAKDARIAELEAQIAKRERENASLRNGKDRRLAGLREAVTMLHERAREMNDPHATAVLNSAALYVGERARALTPPQEGEGHD